MDDTKCQDTKSQKNDLTVEIEVEESEMIVARVTKNNVDFRGALFKTNKELVVTIGDYIF